MSLRETLQRAFAKPFDTVTVQQAADLAQQGAVLLDVREPHEWQAGHAPRARHIPLGHLSRRSSELPAATHILTVCRSGHRSARAAKLLAASGRPVSNVAGGMTAWASAGLPVVAKGGGPGRVA